MTKMKKKREKFRSIRTQLSISIGTMMLVVGLSILLVGATLTQLAFKKQIYDDISIITKLAADRIDSDIRAAEDQVAELAGNFPMNEKASKAIISEYYQKRAEDMGFELFFVVDKNGKGKNLTSSAETFNDLSGSEFFKQAIQGNVYTTSLIKDDISGKKIFVIASPYYKGESIAGVFAGVKDISFISNSCKNFKWKDSGILSVYDKNSQIIGHTRGEIVASDLNLLEKAKSDSSYKEVAKYWKEKVMKSESGVGDYFFTGDQKYAGFYNIKGRDMSVLVSINKSEVKSGLTKFMAVIIITVLTILVISVLLIYFVLAKIIALGFINVEHDISKVSQYNLTAPPSKDYSYRNDELGDIHSSITALKANLSTLVSHIKNSSNALEDKAQDFSQNCEKATGISQEMSSGIDEIAQGATSSAEDTQNGVIQVQLINELLDKNRQDFEALAHSSEETERLKNDGVEKMRALLESTKKNQKISEDIQVAMSETQKSVDEIKTAGEMIQSIADQTNLLALNAAIEAARAGDAGLGFAVVAEEVRKLAENSASFTKQINQSVAELLKRTSYAIEKIKESSDIVDEQSHNVGDMEEKFDGITEAVGKLQIALENVVESNEKIGDAQNTLTSIMENASALSEENAALTEQIAASSMTQNASFEHILRESKKLSELSSELRQLTEKFII